MNLRIGRIGELLEHVTVGNLPGQFVRLVDCTLRSFGGLRQHQPGAEDLQELATFDAHGLRHHHDEFQATRGGDESQRNARVAAGRLDQNGVLVDAAGDGTPRRYFLLCAGSAWLMFGRRIPDNLTK